MKDALDNDYNPPPNPTDRFFHAPLYVCTACGRRKASSDDIEREWMHWRHIPRGWLFSPPNLLCARCKP